MIYIKAFCGNFFHRQCISLSIVRKRKRTYYVVKSVKAF